MSKVEHCEFKIRLSFQYTFTILSRTHVCLYIAIFDNISIFSAFAPRFCLFCLLLCYLMFSFPFQMYCFSSYPIIFNFLFVISFFLFWLFSISTGEFSFWRRLSWRGCCRCHLFRDQHRLMLPKFFFNKIGEFSIFLSFWKF